MRKCFGLTCWMNESCDKPCYPHDYITFAKQIPAWGSPHGRWEVELARAQWSCLTSAILQGSQPQWKMESVMASGSMLCSLIPSYLAARQLTFSLLKWVTAREWPLYAEDFRLAPEETVLSISMFWLLVRWQGLGGMRSEQLWLSCVMILQWVPANW